MKIFGKNLNKEILYVAEIGVNHEGDINRCKKIIRLAKEGGADVVKFQCFSPEKYVSTDEKKFNIIKKFAFSEKQFNEIIKYCKRINIKYLFTPVSHDWIDYLEKNSKTVKVASGDLNFNYLFERILKKKFNIFISSGISDYETLKKIIRKIKNKYKNSIYKKIVLMHCVSNYPVEDKDANILSVKFLKDKFNLITGYSNHVKGINACLLSISLGASVIEFHFTDNKKRKFRDHKLSLDKYDLKKLISIGNNYNLLKGKYEKKINRLLLNSKTLQKGIITSKFLEKNKILKKEDLTFARPAKYFHANDIEKLYGKRLKKNLKRGSLVRKSHLFGF